MRRLLTVRMKGIGLAAGALLFAGVLLAQPQASKSEPVKPPWQRYLQGEDAGKAAELEKKLSRRQDAGELTEALEVAQELAALRARAQGADHWQTTDARFGVQALRRLLRQNEQGRKNYDRSLVLERQAEELEGKGRYAQASPVFADQEVQRRADQEVQRSGYGLRRCCHADNA